MKKLLSALIFMTLAQCALAQQDNSYDKVLADSLGADEYGMKTYYFVLLKTGTNNDPDQEKRNTAFKGHMENISKLVKMNKLIIAGPFGTNDRQYRGIFIINASSVEETKMLLQTDPAISNRYLEPEITEWYGSAAIPLYLNAVSKITKSNF